MRRSFEACSLALALRPNALVTVITSHSLGADTPLTPRIRPPFACPSWLRLAVFGHSQDSAVMGATNSAPLYLARPPALRSKCDL